MDNRVSSTIFCVLFPSGWIHQHCSWRALKDAHVGLEISHEVPVAQTLSVFHKVLDISDYVLKLPRGPMTDPHGRTRFSRRTCARTGAKASARPDQSHTSSDTDSSRRVCCMMTVMLRKNKKYLQRAGLGDLYLLRL